MNSIRSKCISLVCMTDAVTIEEKTLERISKEIILTTDEIDARLLLDLTDAQKIDIIRNVLNYTFKDGNYNWGRIATAILWTRKISKTKEAGDVLADKIASWVEMNGGFDIGFVQYYQSPTRWRFNISFTTLILSIIAVTILHKWM